MAYKKVVLTEKDNSVTKSENQTINTPLNKFDTTYSNKLNELYTEFDKISTTEDIDSDILTDTITKTNVLPMLKEKKSLSFELKVFIVCATLVLCAMFGLCIYNFVVINQLNNSIDIVSEEVVDANGQINDIVNELYQNGKLANHGNAWVNEITENGKINKIVDTTKQVKASVPSNWFDALCDFLSNLFRS